jgi:hypothetical protein
MLPLFKHKCIRKGHVVLKIKISRAGIFYVRV